MREARKGDEGEGVSREVVATTYDLVFEVEASPFPLPLSLRLQVTFEDGADTFVEEGTATADGLYTWSYVATSANGALNGSRIAIEVRDVPGNVASSEVIING